ncbi:hypothetical protein ACUHMQ_13320 [Chitinimonas sp. PSY-7]
MPAKKTSAKKASPKVAASSAPKAPLSVKSAPEAPADKKKAKK